MPNDVVRSEAKTRGARESLIQSFGIKGLYGYRSISLTSSYAATILIARNGSGKTTLLGALDAFLRLQFSRLRNLEFSEIHCKLRDHPEVLVLSHENVIGFLQVPSDNDLLRTASRANIDPTKLFNFLIDELKPSDDSGYDTENEIFSSILSSSNYNYVEASQVCNRLRDRLYERQPEINKIATVITKVLRRTEIVYLPTYRRIELALSEDQRETRRRPRRPKFSVATGSLFTGDIQFGLSDISDRLRHLNQRIVHESDRGYREISANIINDLIDDRLENDTERDLPTEEDLKLFFSRLGQSRRYGPYPPVSVPNISKIYSNSGVPASSSRFLKYFVGQLATVISATKKVEEPVDAFIESCNRYLLSPDPSTEHGVLGNGSPSLPGKALKLNRRDLTVQVESVPEQRKISLDALSSGEKQMISLFARLFLYPDKKIVLIDEPELSLSIDWQAKILVDVLNAPLCEQVIAITHSPFVFNNDLEPFAKSLHVSSEFSPTAQSPDADEAELDD